MNLHKHLHSFVRCALFALLAFSGLRQANALPVCQTDTLASYMTLNVQGGCTYDDLTFFRFSYNPGPVGTGGAALASAADIMVTPIANQVGYGFSFSSSFFQLSNNLVAQSATYNIGYSVDPPPIIVGEGLFLDPPFGNVTVSQNVCLNDVLANRCAFGVQLAQSVTPGSPLSFLSFPYAVPFVDVENTISLSSTPGNPAGFDALQSGAILQATTTTPEPSSAALSLLTVGLGVAGYGWRRRSARQ